ncbi:MAG: tyrosine-type recombinase/integrase [Gammaproteobacteria bacterium]|nr:tyrosine-type recombinase/integrase [Gammaproteobacteria bacterium]
MTEKAVERLNPPKSGRVEYHDTVVSGLSLRVTDKGRKSWSLLYRLPGDPRKRRLTLGVYPAVALTGKEGARERAKDALGKLAGGGDPAADKARQRKDPHLVESVIDDFEKRHLSTLKDGGKAKRILKADVIPAWGRRRISDITRRDVLDLIEEKAQTAPVGANRLLAWVRRLFSWAVNRGLLEHNPASRIPKPSREAARERVLTDAEILTVWQSCEAEGYPYGLFVQFCLLTGQRRGEVQQMKWADLSNGVWTLPTTKAGRAHEVPLPKQAKAILDRCPKMGEFVFTKRVKAPIGVSSTWKARIAPEVPGWTLHDLRRTAASGMARLGVQPHVIARVLNHAETGITGRVYVRHGWLDEKRAALDLWAKKVAAIVEKKSGPAEVVPMEAAR